MKHGQETDAQRLVRALDQEIRGRGRGSIRTVDRAVGRSEGWWQHRAAAGDISVHQLLVILDHLGLDSASFVRRVLGTTNTLGLDRPRGTPPEVVVRAWERVRSGEEGSGVSATWLGTLDRQRYGDPEEAVRLCLWAVEHVELELLPRLLGVAGSAWRLLILLDEAEHAIHAGIAVARLRDDQESVGDLLQRLSYVMADRGNREEALRLAEQAAVLHLRRGDQIAVGKAMVDQGIWLYYLDRAEESIQTLENALERLSPDILRNRLAALQCMGHAHRKIGNLSAALESVILAQGVVADIAVWDKAKLLWLRARIHSDLGELDQAALLLEEVVGVFRELHHGETALATCELVRVLLLLGRPQEAYRTATSMRALLEPLRHNQMISAAIGDLLRSGQAGLTLTLVQVVIARIESECQQGQSWRSLRVRLTG